MVFCQPIKIHGTHVPISHDIVLLALGYSYDCLNGVRYIELSQYNKVTKLRPRVYLWGRDPWNSIFISVTSELPPGLSIWLSAILWVTICQLLWYWCRIIRLDFAWILHQHPCCNLCGTNGPLSCSIEVPDDLHLKVKKLIKKSKCIALFLQNISACK